MKISQITISASRTVNLGNFNNIKIEGSVTINLDENDLIDDARNIAVNEIKQQMKTAFTELKPK